MSKLKITLLGATGSIGKSTLDVIRRNTDRYQVFALTAASNTSALLEQCLEFKPRYAVITVADKASDLRRQMKACGLGTELLVGRRALQEVAGAAEVDVVMAAIVGAAGLQPTLSAVTAGKRVLLANKEALVMSGHLFSDAVAQHNAELLPVDSEHNAIFQCLPARFQSLTEAGVAKLVLTGSGGPLRRVDLAALAEVTPEQACAHPNWSMGRKISVDSATMMNKGLEYIEACWLFKARAEQLEVLVHPQSIVHSMVQYRDGSVLAQMGRPDMRTPIAHCLAWPERIDAGVAPLDLVTLSDLSFEAPDFERFPCLKLAMEALSSGGDCPVALNAANEVAVAHFLDGRIAYPRIAAGIAEVMEKWQAHEPESIEAVIDADQRARVVAEAVLASV